MRTVQLMNKMLDASKNIFRVKWFTRHETDRFLNHCQECVRAYLSIHDCLSFRHKVMIDNHRNKTTES
jgi:GTP-dependent phosphoenolpyruvate carboxykinase